MAVDQGLRSRLHRRLEELPVLPTIVTRLMMLDRNDEDYFDDLVELVESAPNFATRLLVLSNSAQSAPVSPISTTRAAVARLGSSASTNLLTALGVTRVFVPQDQWERSLWRHSLHIAAGSRALALVSDNTRLKPDECHTAGLLHDLGRFIMFQEAPDTLREVDEGDWNDPQKLIDVEIAICGVPHTELAEVACKQWNLPSNISEAALRHHDPVGTEPSTSITDMIVDIVRFADIALFPSALDSALDLTDERVDELLAILPPFIQLSAEALTKLVTQSLEDAETAAAALGI